jgi:peptidyl-prolyl cis-trans isomerase D
MAVLETIRNKFGILITVLIAVALLSFIIDPTSLSSLTGGQQMGEDVEVASINGKSISYTEFSDEVRKNNDLYPFDMVMNVNDTLTDIETKKDMYNKEIRNKVMNSFVMDNLLVVKAKEAGFNVSEEELYQLLAGMYMPEDIRNYENATDMTKVWWEDMKKSVESENYLAKYYEIFSRSSFANSLLMEEEIKNSNNVFDVEFVMVPFGADTTVAVSDKEIEEYYNAHKNLFPVSETRDIEYIVVEFNDENEDAVFAQVDSLFNDADIENFSQLAVDNGFFHDTISNMSMFANSFGSYANVENIVKWAYKEENAGAVSEIYTVNDGDENYFIVAALSKINPEGYAPLEQAKAFIENTLISEKVAENKLAEVAAKINGITDLKSAADALGTTVSTKEKLTFASSDFDQKFTGAASVAQEGVMNTVKGSNGIYVYQVTNRSEEAYFTEDDAQVRNAQLGAAYAQMLPYVLNKEGKVKDYTYLYF